MGFSFLGLFLFLQALDLPYGSSEKNLNLKTQILSLLLFSLGYCLVGYYWIPYTLKEFGSIPIPFNTLLGAFFSLIIVPQYLAFILLLFAWKKLNIKKSSLAGGASTRNLIFALILVVLENLIPQQFPAHIGHTWLQLAPRLGLAPLFGAPLMSFASYALILSLVSLWRQQKFDFFGPIIFIIVLVINLLLPLERNPFPRDEGKDLKLRLVQANIGNFMKLDSESGGVSSMREIYKRYYEMSTLESKKFPGEKLDLIIWPETAYPQLLNTSMMRVSPAFIPSVVRKSIEKSGAQVFFGGYDKSGSENKNFFETEYNAGFLINRMGKVNDVYHKMLLIPFGESLPFGPLNPLLAKVIKNMAFFAKGQNYTLFKLDGGQTFISAICYEILFSGFIRKYLNSTPNSANNQADFIINLTNDSWYGDTSEPYQHQYLAFWRALEFQIPIVRMTNTGISSVLYPDGSQSKSLGVFKKDVLDINLELGKREATFFQRWGLIPLFGIFTFLFLLALIYETKFSKLKDS